MANLFERVVKGNAKRLLAVVLMLGVLFAAIPITAMSSKVSADDGEILLSGADISDNNGIISNADKDEKDTAVSAGDTEITSESDAVSVSDSDMELISVSDSEIAMYGISLLAADDIASGTSGTCSWVIDADGVLTIYPTNGVSGTLARTGTQSSPNYGWNSYKSKVTSVVVEPGVAVTGSAEYMFYGYKNCISMDLKNLDTSGVTSMRAMFFYCEKLESIDVSGFDTSNVTEMHYMFAYCDALESIDVSSFDVSKVGDFQAMFGWCSKLKELDLSSFVTSSATNMKEMMRNCPELRKVDMSNFTLPSTNTGMYMMFINSGPITEYTIGASWIPGADYGRYERGNHFVNVVDGELIYNANSNCGVKSVTIHNGGSNISVDLDQYPESYPSFTGNMTATIVFAPQFSVFFYNDYDETQYIGEQRLFLGETAKDPYEDPSKIPVQKGQHFTGWSPALDNLNPTLHAGDLYYSMYVHAVWKNNTYTIHFDPNGGTGTMADLACTYGTSKYLTNNSFTRTGGTFLGWNTDKNADTALYADKARVKDLTDEHEAVITLYAIWKMNAYKVRFYSKGGTGTMADQSFVCGTAQNLSKNAFTKTGYKFIGWNTSSSAGTALYTDEQEVADLTSVNGRTVTLYAQWALDEYTIDFDSNGGTEVADITQDYNTDVTAPADPTREGYTFAGWDTEIPAKMPAKDMKITAKWNINEYTIDFDSNGGSEVADITQDYNTDVTAPADPTREGYTFAGWDTEIPAKMPAKDMKITAKWNINEYTIDFDSNGGSEVADITQNYNTDVTKPADPTREGYTFAGWDTEIPAKIPANDMKITASWTANTYLVAFDANSGEGTMADQEMVFDTPANLSANTFTKKNYEFVGWSLDSTAATPDYTDCQEVVNLSTGDKVTLYAVWSKNAVAVTASAGKGGSVTPEEANVLIGGNIDISITTDERYEIEKVTVNGEEIDLSTLSESGSSKVLSLTGVTEDTDVAVSFSAEPIVGTPSVVFADSDKVFKVNENIEFEAIGFWQTTAERITGDEYYVPLNWHHADPSGDWGGVDDSSYDYSASFKRSKAGTYILKVEFCKYVYDGTAWVDSGIVTIETEYIVKGEVKGESDTPDTGDNGAGVFVALNLMLISAFGVIICIQWNRRKKKENA